MSRWRKSGTLKWANEGPGFHPWFHSVRKSLQHASGGVGPHGQRGERSERAHGGGSRGDPVCPVTLRAPSTDDSRERPGDIRAPAPARGEECADAAKATPPTEVHAENRNVCRPAGASEASVKSLHAAMPLEVAPRLPGEWSVHRKVRPTPVHDAVCH